jgi:hypothetical protein
LCCNKDTINRSYNVNPINYSLETPGNKNHHRAGMRMVRGPEKCESKISFCKNMGKGVLTGCGIGAFNVGGCKNLLQVTHIKKYVATHLLGSNRDPVSLRILKDGSRRTWIHERTSVKSQT